MLITPFSLMSGAKKGRKKLGKGLTAQVHRLLAVAVSN